MQNARLGKVTQVTKLVVGLFCVDVLVVASVVLVKCGPSSAVYFLKHTRGSK